MLCQNQTQNSYYGYKNIVFTLNLNLIMFKFITF